MCIRVMGVGYLHGHLESRWFVWHGGICAEHLAACGAHIFGIGAFAAWIGEFVSLLLGSFGVGVFGISLCIWHGGVCELILFVHLVWGHRRI